MPEQGSGPASLLVSLAETLAEKPMGERERAALLWLADVGAAVLRGAPPLGGGS